MKYGAVEVAPGSPWAVWPDVGALAARLPAPGDELMAALSETPKSWLRRLLMP